VTIRPTAVPELDVTDISAAFEARVRAVSPEHAILAKRLLARLSPARWTLEWYLPWWLGHAFGLDPRIARDLVLSNVLGLGSIRLQDDLADGEVDSADVAGATVLAAALYQAALAPYRARFAVRSPFWAHLDGCMVAWREATEGTSRGRLAAVGAPLRISAFAACLLAGRPDAYRSLERCLDGALEGTVRLDHIADWEADLDAVRWNAFVAALSPGPQVPARRAEHRRAVLVALMTSNAIADQCALIEARMLKAARTADHLTVPMPSLGAHLRDAASDVRARGTAWQARYRDLGDRAARLLIREPIGAR
jgi:hypothetical protein